MGLEIKDDVFSTGPLPGLAWCGPHASPLELSEWGLGGLFTCAVLPPPQGVPITLKIQLKAFECLFLTLTEITFLSF